MKDIKVIDVIKQCNGKLLCGDENTILESFSKDTRTINIGDVYLGIKGDTFNGSLLYKEAFEKGASVCILDDVKISKEDMERYKDKVIIKVENTVKALQDLAAYKRSLYNIPVIGITGSVGKTSTKDLIASVVSQKYKVLKTEGNLNNEIGMPLTILKLKDHEALVLEMGSDKFGDLSLLTKIAKPTICVLTIIGTSHIANFGSRENILKGKLEILEGLCEDKIVVLNNDNDLLNKWRIDNDSDYNPINVSLKEFNSNYDVKVQDNKYNINVPVGGKHFVYNSLAALAIGKHLNIDIDSIIKGIETFELTKMRMDISTYNDNVLVINDTYNASYDSMKSGLEYLKGLNNKTKVAILGDMLELGEYSEQLHRKVGKCVIENNIDILITIGKEAKYIADEAKKQGLDNIYICDTNLDATNVIKNNIVLSDTAILIKASRGMRLEEISNYIKDLYN